MTKLRPVGTLLVQLCAIALLLLNDVTANIVLEPFSFASPFDPGMMPEGGIPLNPDVIEDDVCRDDTLFFLSAAESFVSSMTLNCSETDVECLQTVKTIAETNTFAAQQMDSFGRIPSNLLGMNGLWMGSWEECMSISAPTRSDYKTQFCYVGVATANSAQSFSQSALGNGAVSADICDSAAVAQWSVCMPRTCSNKDISLFFRTMNNSTRNLLKFCNAQCRPATPPKQNAAFWVVVAFLLLGAALVVISSALDYGSDTIDDPRIKQLRKNLCLRCLFAFSAYTNGATILDATKRPGQICCLDCIRTFSITWVICGHVLMNYMYGDNILKTMDGSRYFLNDAFLNAFYSVDSFLFIGGLLLAYLFYRDMDKTPAKLRSPSYWILYYVHRILRLSPPYFLFIGVSATMHDHLTLGPMPLSFMLETENCKRNWWRNMLYINNIFDLKGMCMAHTWYLSVDMQIHIFAPLLLIPLCLSKIAGAVAGLLFLALGIAANYGTYAKYKFPATYVGFFGDALDPSKLEPYEQFMYFASWIRFTPYLIGVFTGYFLHKTRGKKLWMHPILAVVLWLASIAIGIGCVYGLYDYLQGPTHNIPTMARASFYCWSRIGWAIALAWVVIACQNNWAGPLKNFMELGFWAPFGRLTYCTYLTHFLLVAVILSMERTPMHFINMAHAYMSTAIPAFVVSYAFAFVWSCTFEIPFQILEKMLIGAILGGARRPLRNDAVQDAPQPKVDNRERGFGKEENWGTDERSARAIRENQGVSPPPYAQSNHKVLQNGREMTGEEGTQRL